MQTNKIARKLFGFIVLIFLMGVVTINASANTYQFSDSMDEKEIERVINHYFESRYHSLQVLNQEDISLLIDQDSSETQRFWRKEFDKIEIDIMHAKLYHLRYVSYIFYLNFKDISLDPSGNMASVTVVEGHDVIFEISNPNISSMRNLNHTISLRKIDGFWKIASDYYNDYLWKYLQQTGKSKGEILRAQKAQSATMGLSDIGNTDDNTGHLPSSLPPNTYSETDTNTYPYNRIGAVSYAHIWYQDFNPNYFNFTDLGGDCTNFVSQAIHDGGGAIMSIVENPGIGTSGWYYNNVNERASAWTDVSELFKFLVTEKNFYITGPEGSEKLQYEVYEGDIIQFDWGSDDSWDHSAIIVQTLIIGII